jgi:cytosine/adenosine deaminase-related metal-dependent hydrolase
MRNSGLTRWRGAPRAATYPTVRLFRIAIQLTVPLLLLANACGSSSTSETGGDAGDAGRKETGPDAAPADAGKMDAPAKDAAPDSPAEASPPDGSTVPGLCTVAAKGKSGVVLAGRLLLPAGPTTGELFIDGTGKIACAAATCGATAGYASATRITCANGVIGPALVNAHDHTEYATRAPESHGLVRYDHRNDWRRGADGATPLPTVESTSDTATIAGQELRFILGGTTSIIGSGAVSGLTRNLASYESSDLEGLSSKAVNFETFPLGDSDGVVLTSGCGYPGIVSTAKAFEDGVFAAHLGEGVNLGAENELGCAAATGNDLITSETSVIHGVGFNANDVAVVAAAGARLIWSPRSNLSLYGDTAPLTEYKNAGVTIALGTDWLPSGSMNELRELACADSFNQKYLNATFSDQELWQMATINAAIAAGFDTEIGSLEVGKIGDVVVFDGSTEADYRAVIAAGVEDVHLVLRGGKVLYGDTPLVSALASGCEAFPVCGEDRSLCFDVSGVTLGNVESKAASIYPLFFCKTDTPSAEPSCTPYRDSYPSGTSATDRDGDGIPDATDDCPDIFNPIRPMDGAAQADVDGDGFGDACDSQPLDSTMH